ncbi:MAG TPA: hypothetical protein VNJ08_10980 [Bacteriovoracaceae bacterium]|nr:hypothetical protein [Bacteriovoracaceae bacterium]
MVEFNGGGDGGGPGGDPGGGTPGEGCTLTQGYWGSAPAGEARLIQLVGAEGLELGNRTYSAVELDAILDSPAGGQGGSNMLHILAIQLIAAKLNVLNDADDSQIADDIELADTLIGNLIIEPIPGYDTVSPNSTLGQQMDTVKKTLDSYNNGNLNVPKCD